VLAQERLGDAAGLLAEALAIAEICGDMGGICVRTRSWATWH
jgi:hypothetical protein